MIFNEGEIKGYTWQEAESPIPCQDIDSFMVTLSEMEQ